jgi:DNA polymerase-3 subunit alpha
MAGGTALAETVQQLRGDATEFAEAELQTFEHELLGFYVTSHPLKRVANRLRWLTTHTCKDISEASDGSSVIIGGLANSIEKKLTKTNKLLAIIHMEDLTGKIEAVAFGDILEKIDTSILTPQSLLLVKGKIRKGDEATSVSVNSVRRIADANLVNIFFTEDQSFTDLHKLKSILTLHKGDDPVLLHFPQGKRSQAILVGCQFWVNACEALSLDIQKNFRDTAKVLVNRVAV